ncbi:uncharacterized protein FYW49_012848 [Xenentodon cancila]
MSKLPSFIIVLYSLIYNGHAQDVVLTIEPSWSTFIPGEFVTFTCDMKEGTNDDWEYKIIKDANRPKARLVQDTKTTPVGGSVTLSCSVENSAGWKYDWFRRTSTSPEVPVRTNVVNEVIRVSQGGIYRCRGSRGEPAVYTDMSDDVTCEITFTNKVVVVRRPDWPQIFRGERITLTCEVQGGETTEWIYEWRRSGSDTQWSYQKTWTFTASESSSGDYTCKTRRRDDPYSSTETSEADISTYLERASLPFAVENHVLGFGGADSHSSYFELGCKPSQNMLKLLAQ